jgi:hypothetical protein
VLVPDNPMLLKDLYARTLAKQAHVIHQLHNFMNIAIP